jgi:hypothetical protein
MRCIECGIEAVDAKGWRAFIDHADEETDEPRVILYCAVSAWREFGPTARHGDWPTAHP